MRFKKLLMIGVCGVILNVQSAHAYPACASIFCFWQDPLSMVAGFLLRESNKKLLNPTYDIKDGLEKIKENIGMYQNEGKCGVSATGETGCDLASGEEGGESGESGTEGSSEASVIPDSTISIIQKSEAQGEITFDESSQSEDKRDQVARNGNTFDQVRENVGEYMFASQEASDPVNSECTCSSGTGADCDPTECAQTRQNDALVVATTAASSVADTYLNDIEKNYGRLEELVSDVNSAETIADFVGKLGYISIYASSAVVDQMVLQAYDLRAQSYRNLISSGIEKVDMTSLTEGANK